MVSNLVNAIPRVNESLYSIDDYSFENMEHHNLNANYSGSGSSQHLAAILQQLFFKMSDDQEIPETLSNSNLSDLSFSTSLLSYETSLPVASGDPKPYGFLIFISFWFVLIVNPIVILFGVTGNLLATYILIRCNICKLPVSFYTIMLNISDTLNLLIPVFIFWLDNCINRTLERGYFRDRSNFLCKALLCPDQLFAALSAWYMCAISFNRWSSVCRPSSFFSRSTKSPTTHDTNREYKRKSSVLNLISNSSCKSFWFPFDCCYCLTRNIKFRQHLQAFRSIAFITFMGILCCLYPIFMHELRQVISTDEHVLDLKHKKTHKYTIVWKRCYYIQNHEYAYDIIGIILSCFLHILPLTFVALMNIMIIVQLRKRQRLLTISANLIQVPRLKTKKKKSSNDSYQRLSAISNCPTEKKDKDSKLNSGNSSPTLTTFRKDQAISTDLSIPTLPPSTNRLTIPRHTSAPRRHHSRDRAITIMLVSVALSYLLLTLPYRLFWTYNVYIKRMYPEKLKSSVYLLKMHYIDHILRTIRNIHYGTNFVFFIFLSKTFRRKFRQLFIDKFLQAINCLFYRRSTTRDITHASNSEINHQRHINTKFGKKQTTKFINSTCIGATEYGSNSVLNDLPNFINITCTREDEIIPIVNLENNHLPRYDGEQKN